MTTSTTGDCCVSRCSDGHLARREQRHSDSRVCSSIIKQLRYITTKTVTDLVCHFMTDQAPRATSSATATTAPLSTTVVVHPARVCGSLLCITSPHQRHPIRIGLIVGMVRIARCIEPNAVTRERIATRFDRKVPLERRSESTTWKLGKVALLIGSIQRRHCNDRRVGQAAQQRERLLPRGAMALVPDAWMEEHHE